MAKIIHRQYIFMWGLNNYSDLKIICCCDQLPCVTVNNSLAIKSIKFIILHRAVIAERGWFDLCGCLVNPLFVIPSYLDKAHYHQSAIPKSFHTCHARSVFFWGKHVDIMASGAHASCIARPAAAMVLGMYFFAGICLSVSGCLSVSVSLPVCLSLGIYKELLCNH